jgi:hypothetical protein
MKKKKIMEIIDSNEIIIGNDDKPKVDRNIDTQSNSTTDRASKIAHQPFDDTFWGTFGFSIYETLSEDELIKIAEDVITKKNDKSLKNKKNDREFIDSKKKIIKDLFSDLSDAEKGDLINKLKKK